MRAAFAAAALPLALVGCGDDGADEEAGVRVLAAASLTEAFTELATTFEEETGTDVTLSFGGSAALAEQVIQGAPADVLVTADEPNMAKVEDAEDVTIIARNRLSILVEPGNPKGIVGLAGLARDGVVTVLCAPSVPCGRFAAMALEKAGVQVDAASVEESVKGVVAKVTLGEADAGIVYVTDVRAAGDAAAGVAIDIADDPALEAVYPMAVLADAADVDAAREWVDFVAGETGRETLAAHGFLAP